ncbi:hypothetical protein GVAV_003200 [Gurleya vavrai]
MNIKKYKQDTIKILEILLITNIWNSKNYRVVNHKILNRKILILVENQIKLKILIKILILQSKNKKIISLKKYQPIDIDKRQKIQKYKPKESTKTSKSDFNISSGVINDNNQSMQMNIKIIITIR